MKHAESALNHELGAIRTGRASPALLDRIRVDYYGTLTPIPQVAAVSTPESRLLVIQPWDRQLVGAIEKAILKSDLGLTPTNDGKVVRLAIPLLTEERRKDLVKMIRRRVEEGRVAVRNCRRDSVDELKKLERDKKVSEDESRRGQERLQKETDRLIAELEQLGQRKEQEVTEV
jgi:ribosome recycling factor